MTMKTKTYACYSLDEKERALSSSGGIYPLIAKKVLEAGGVVYAACYDEELNVVHKRISDASEILKSQGSKYAASKLGSTFSDVTGDISSGKKVMFVGTPCQCAGLSSFVQKKGLGRSGLLLLDFICHGVPGERAYKAYKDSFVSKGKKLVALNMRDKSLGWSRSNYSFKETFDDGSVRVTPRRQVPYMKGMLANLYTRPSCFKCRFKGAERCTDITLGDYWGVWDQMPQMDDGGGTSLVLIHTDEGERLFEEIRPLIKSEEADIEMAASRNACLLRSTDYNPDKSKFYEGLDKGEDFDLIIERLTKESTAEKLFKKIKKKFLRR